MEGEVIVGILALVGTLAGTYFSNRKSAALMEYRLQKLEQTVAKHNEVVERTFVLEGKMHNAEENIEELKKFHQP